MHFRRVFVEQTMKAELRRLAPLRADNAHAERAVVSLQRYHSHLQYS